MERKVILTPIAKQVKKEALNPDGTRNLKIPDSRRDYTDQMYREQHQGLQMMWDDSDKNKAICDDVLLFYEYNNCVTVRKVLQIGIERDPSWPDTVGHRNRQVLYLSPQLYSYSWHEWVNINGYTHIVRDTMYVKCEDLKHEILSRF
jgi:hypothetical protein